MHLLHYTASSGTAVTVLVCMELGEGPVEQLQVMETGREILDVFLRALKYRASVTGLMAGCSTWIARRDESSHSTTHAV